MLVVRARVRAISKTEVAHTQVSTGVFRAAVFKPEGLVLRQRVLETDRHVGLFKRTLHLIANAAVRRQRDDCSRIERPVTVHIEANRGFSLDDGTAQAGVETTELLGRLRVGKRVSRVEIVVSVEVIKVAVVLVRTRLRHRIDLRSGKSPVLRAVRIGLNLEFLNGVHVDARRNLVSSAAVIVHAIEHQLIRVFGLPGDAETAATAKARSLSRSKRTRNQVRELSDVSAIQRQFDNLAVVHRRCKRRIFRLNQGRGGIDLHHFGDVADLQGHVCAGLLVYVQLNSRTNFLSEAREFCLNSIFADRQQFGVERSGLIGNQ